LFPIRIISSWSKTLSLIHLTYADTTFSPLRASLKLTAMSSLCQKWQEKDPRSLEPPFIPHLAKYFSALTMKISNSEIIQSNPYLSPRRSSPLKSPNISKKSFKKKKKSQTVLVPISEKIKKKPELKEKLIKIKKRQQELRRVKRQKWTKKDILFMKMASEPKM